MERSSSRGRCGLCTYFFVRERSCPWLSRKAAHFRSSPFHAPAIPGGKQPPSRSLPLVFSPECSPLRSTRPMMPAFMTSFIPKLARVEAKPRRGGLRQGRERLPPEQRQELLRLLNASSHIPPRVPSRNQL